MSKESSLTQFPGGDGRKVTDLVIGLDFGTSCSKVIVRSPTVAGERAVAVPVTPRLGRLSRYFFPSALMEGADGTLSLDREDSRRLLAGLKMRLYEDPDSHEAASLAAAYLALVLRRARRWFLRTQRDAYAGFRFRWHLNVGLPSAGYDDARIRGAFRRVAEAAWILSVQSDEVDAERAGLAVDGYDSHMSKDVPIEVVPEVAAEVVGYARSRMRERGLHLIVDIGALTVDVCGFILHERDEGDLYNLLTAVVRPLGTHKLHARRIRELNGLGIPLRENLLCEQEPTWQVPNSVRSYVPKRMLGTAQAAAIDSAFAGECARCVMSVIAELKSKREPKSSRWQDGLPIFLCGGGRYMPLYAALPERAVGTLQRTMEIAGGLVLDLKRPRSLANEDVDEDLFQRLAVAYGLSFDALNIGKILPPSATPDLPKPARRDWGRKFVSKDQV